MLVPKVVTTLKDYSLAAFYRDAVAGVIVGVVALPLAIAFGIASGVSPEKGLITAVVAGFIISALGGSRVQIGGPTGAFIVVVYGVVERFGIDGLIVTTILAGVLLVLMGLAKLGAAIKYIPSPVITGFTSGIAVIIASSQVKDFFGLQMSAVPADFFEKWKSYWDAAVHTVQSGSFNPLSLLVALLTLVILRYWTRLEKRIPPAFVALIFTTLLVQVFNLEVITIGGRFGAIPSTFPTPHLPAIDFATIKLLMPSVFTIAILAAIESLLSAVVADGMLGTRHRSNMELVAQGIANIASPLFGGIPATGAIARTATNIRSGGRTPVAGLIHALTLLLIMLLFGKWAGMIPLATLAAILLMVAYNMSEWRTFRAMLKYPRSDVIVLLTTFVLTVAIDLTVAIEAGMVLAAFLFMRRMAEVTNVSVIGREIEDSQETDSPLGIGLPNGVQIYEINGPFFFGAAEKFSEAVLADQQFPRILIIRMRHVPAIDATGIRALEDILNRTRRQKATMLLSEIAPQPFTAMEKAGFLKNIGPAHISITLGEALDLARGIVKP